MHRTPLLALLAFLAPVVDAQSPGLVGTWRVDSLAVYPLTTNLPDSTRQLQERYQEILRGAVAQFRTGEMSIVTSYRADGTYEHEVRPRGAEQPASRDRGTWTLDADSNRISCQSESGRGCVHHRAVIEQVTSQELILRLELTGSATGLGEYFRLRRQ